MENKFIIEDVTPRFIIEDVEDTTEQTQADQTTDQPEVVSEETTNVEPPKKQMGVAAKTVASTPKKNMVSGSEVGSSDFRKNKFVETTNNKEIDGVSIPRSERLLKPKKEIKYSETDNKIEQGKKILQTGIERGKERQKLIETQQVKSKPNLRPISEFKAEKQKEESDSFSNYLKEAWDSAASTVVKSVYEAPEYAYEFIASNVTDPVFNKARELAGEKPVYSSADKIMDTFNIRNVPADILKERINKSNKVIEDYSLKNGVDPLTAIENKNYLGAMKLTAGATVQSAPLMLAALLSGGSSAAMAGIAASTAVTKSGELKAEQPEMDVQTRANNAAVSGLLEGYLGNLFTGASGAVVKRIIADKGVDAGSKIISNGLMSTLEKTIAKNPMVGVLGEVAEESAVELGNQLNDINSGIRTELDNRAIINAGIVATGMSGVNTVPIYAAKGYVKLADYNAVKKVNKEINRLSSQLTSQYIDDDSKKLISSRITRLVDSNKAILGASLEKLNALPNNVKTEISDINLGIDDIRNQYIDILDNNDIDDNLKKSLVEELEVQARELSNRKSSIIEGNYIYEDFNKLPEVDKVKYKDLALVNLQEESVINGESKKSFDDASILKSASELYNADRKSADISTDIANTKRAAKIFGLSSNISMPEINNAKDLYDYLSTNTNLKENEIEDYSESLGLFVPLTDSNGNPTGKRALIINKENADIENVVTTGQHEFLHELLYNSVKNDPAAQKKIGTALYKYLDSTIQTEEFNNTAFKKRYETYKSDFESKKLIIEQKLEKAKTWLSEGRITQEQYDTALESGNNNISTYEGNFLEETLPLLSESLSSGDIKYNETFFTKLGDILRRFFQKYGLKKISFETGKDVFNFVKDYNKSFEKGEFGKAFKSLKEGKANIAKGKTISKASIKESIASPKVVALEKELQDLEDEYDEGYGDMADDEYRAKKNNIEAKIKTTIRKEAEAEASGKKVVVEKEPTNEEEEVKKIIREERGSLSSDKVQQIYTQKGLSGAQDIINLFRPITKKIVDKRRDAPGFDRELLTDEIETGDGGILDLIRKYKPESGVPLAAYINKYLPLRAIATSRRILDAQFSKDVTEEVGLMATETADQNMTERMPEKSKYKNVLESNVFEPEVLKTMTNKILTNVRTLRSRFDTPTSLNKTVSPLMAEITSEIGKQLDIDIKTEMGGKKDNQLKNWLIKNKRYVLENMTTTWLMGKDGQGGMPQAIQKRIDGRWVNFPDWVGQKIDRESTSTDLAGRTSGHELVRRLPNVFNNVSNEDYLAQVLEPGGNPLRGRKESLAKAIAEEASLDIISQDLKEQGPIYEAFVANQQRVGAEISDAIANEFDRQVERGNVKQSIPVRLGVIQSQDKLANELFNAPNEDAEVSIIKKWLASDGRSIRTLVSIIFKGNHKWTTNKGIFEDILLPIISSSSKFNWVISGNSIGVAGKDSFNLKDVPKGQSIYFGEEKVPLWADVEYIKKNWEGSIGTINKEALEATDNIIDIVNYFKNKRGTEFGTVYHGGDIVDLDSISDSTPLFVTESDSEAIAYSKGNDGHTFVANIDMNTIAKEEVARDILQEMGYDEEYMLHELIDPRFESTYIGDDNVKKLYQEVKKQGYEGVEFMDTGIADKRNVTNIVLVAPKKTLRNSGFDTTRIVNERKAIDLLEEGYKPVINGDVVENVTEDEIGTLLSKNGTIKMTKYNPRPTERYTEKDFRNYLSILKYDQRGLIRKLHKAGMAVLGMKSSDVPYLEHNKPSYDVAEEIVNLFNGKITEDEFRSIVSNAKVNLIPDALNEYLPKYVEGQNRMHADDVVLYLKALEDSGLKLLDLQNEYDSRENFDKMVAEAIARNVTKHSLPLSKALEQVMPEPLTVKQSKAKSDTFNRIIGEVTDMDQNKVFSDITARRRGAGLNKYDFYVPPSAADFELLLYNFMGKGKQGEEHKKFFDDQFLKPYSHGIDLMDSARQDIKNDFKSISNAFPKVKKKLESLIPDKDFTYDQALRVAIWSESSAEIPGLSREDQTKLADLVNNDIELNAFKEGLKRTSRQPDGWLKPEDFWETKTIISDLHDITEGVGRKKFLEEFIENVEAIFGKWNNGKLVGENMNKIEAVYGTNVREALEDSLYRMSNGKNRSSGQDKEANAWMNWVNGSTGAIMFLNTRSALLQLTGAVNFLNLRDNNPIMAAKAFANQPQYWQDFAMIFNSDKIKERRSGLKDDVSAAEIANAAKGAKNKAGAVLSYLLKIGYTPTQIADSLAIAIGGAPFYRNRVNSYKSEYEGLDDNGNLKRKYSDDEAETKAWDDFSKVSDETQQSGDPRDISKQQASSVGRLILAFQNTSMQQSRIIKKSYLDLKNGRGDAITNIAKITYYLAIQNTMFAVLQSGLFALMFDEDDEDDKEKAKKKKTGEDKALEIGNSVLDSVLRGTGFGGAIVATLKNIAVKYMEESDKGYKGDYTKVLLEGANISPPIGSKARKAYSAMQTSKYEKDLMDRRKWDIMQNGRVHLSPRYHVGAKAIEAVTNVPLDRFVNKVENISEAMNAENKAWQRVMVGLGYTPYSVGIQNTGDEEIKAEIKAEKKIASKEKAKAKREFVKDSIANLPPEEYLKYLEKKSESKQKKKDSIAALSPEEYLKYLDYRKNKRKKSPKASSAGNFIIE